MLSGLGLITLAFCCLAGVFIDMLLGEPRRWHPLSGFGHLAAAAIERRLNPMLKPALHPSSMSASGAGDAVNDAADDAGKRTRGIAGWMLAVMPLVLLACLLIWLASAVSAWLAALLHIALLYFSLGLRSLREHALPIGQALKAGDLEQARVQTSRIVSRDTQHAGESDLSRAAVESVLENGNDAVFGALFWFIVAGGPGALLFRLANTLDAMWGYRTPRFAMYGWFAARTDDVLNWIPARLTAFSYAVLGDVRTALSCWKSQAASWSSPNAGPVMASGAGSLGVRLGGEASYGGIAEKRPLLGAGAWPRASDIERAWRLVARTTGLWLALVVLAACLF